MNILLCCLVGMFISLLVIKMEVVVKVCGLEGKIWVVFGDVVKMNID